MTVPSTVKVLFDYEAEQDDELTLHKGDIVTNVSADSDGWYIGTINGKTGVFPDNFVEAHTASPPKPAPPKPAPPKSDKPAAKLVKCTFDHEKGEPDELSIKVGDIITVLEEPDADWWKGELPGGEVGMFPSNFVEPYDGPAPQKPAAEENQIYAKKVHGIGLGNIFAGGAIKLRKTGGIPEKKKEAPTQPARAPSVSLKHVAPPTKPAVPATTPETTPSSSSTPPPQQQQQQQQPPPARVALKPPASKPAVAKPPPPAAKKPVPKPPSKPIPPKPAAPTTTEPAKPPPPTPHPEPTPPPSQPAKPAQEPPKAPEEQQPLPPPPATVSATTTEEPIPAPPTAAMTVPPPAAPADNGEWKKENEALKAQLKEALDSISTLKGTVDDLNKTVAFLKNKVDSISGDLIQQKLDTSKMELQLNKKIDDVECLVNAK